MTSLDEILDFLERAALIEPGERPRFDPLAGGVSSDIWAVRTRRGTVCVKRALARLRVEADWRADPSRNATEVAWLRQVAVLLPDNVPKVLASDRERGVFAMEYLPPAEYETWKSRLAQGAVGVDVARVVGRCLATIHSAFARSATAAADFDTGAAFHALRLEPYLLATATRHPDLADVLDGLAQRTARTRLSVAHGDISPKNILLGRRGPIFLDAECAWFGDPAFDLAFCLNHLLLKSLWVPAAASELLASFDALSRAYLDGVDWEEAAQIEERAATLLPGLLLARVDGKSPVDYLDAGGRDTVRQGSRWMLGRPVRTLSRLRQAWADREWRHPRVPVVERFRIARVRGRRVWDSRARPTVEAEVWLESGHHGRAIAPAGASRGLNEAIDLRDGGPGFDGFGVDRAVGHVNTEIADALRGLPALDQEAIDRRLIECDGSPTKARLGGNALVAVSMAALHAAAAAREQPLWRHLAGDAEPLMPMPMVQIFGGGAHAGGRVDLQDFLVVPVGASSFAEAIEMAARVYDRAGRIMAERGLRRGVADEGGWWPEFQSNAEALDSLVTAIEQAGLEPGVDVALAIDVAASQLRVGSGYRFASEDRELTSDELADLLVGWCARYPIVSVEDPVGEDDHAGMRLFTSRVPAHVQVIGDDYLVTSADRVRAAATAGACNAVLLKPNQAGTITETAAALNAARDAGWNTVVSARSGETEDVTIVHLAIGWRAGQLKVGSSARGERTAKWNEAIRIEEQLGRDAALARPFRPVPGRGAA